MNKIKISNKNIEIILVLVGLVFFYLNSFPILNIIITFLLALLFVVGLVLKRGFKRNFKSNFKTGFKPYIKRFLFFIFALFAFSIIGLLNNIFVCKSIFAAGLPREEITVVQGRALSDTRKTPSANMIAIKAFEVSSPTARASSVGNITIMFKGEQKIYKSGLVQARGRIVSDTLFIADEIEFLAYSSSLQEFRALLREKIYIILEQKASGGLLSALFLGDRNLISPGTTELFQKAGCMHILALSGMHIGFIASITGLICAIFFKKFTALVVTLIIEFAYCFLVNTSPSVIRALLMSSIGIISILFSLRWSGIKVFAIAFLMQALIQPGEVTNIGFLLSYAAVFGILSLNSLIYKNLLWLIPNKFLSASFSVSLSAIFCTIPFMFAISPQYNMGGIFASLIMTPPIIALILLCPITLFVTSFVPSLDRTVDFIIAVFEKIVIKILEITSASNWLILEDKKILIFYIVFFLLFFYTFLVKIIYKKILQRLNSDKFQLSSRNTRLT